MSEWLDVLPTHDDELLAVAGSCDLGSGWVRAALASGCSLTTRDVKVIEQTKKRLANPVDREDLIREYRSRGDQVVSGSVHVHEETHFYQLILTPFGRLLGEIERYFVSDIVQITKELSEAGAIGPDSLPLREWARANLQSNSSRDRILAQLVDLAHAQSYGLKSCLFGIEFKGLSGEIENPTVGDALEAWRMFLCAQDRAEEAVDTPELNIQQVSHPSHIETDLDENADAVPTIDGYCLTPREIFEGAALEIQLNHLRATLSDNPDLSRILRIVNPGLVDTCYLATRRLLASAFPRLNWPQRRSLMLILSDLALWGVTHRDYLGGADVVVKWEDLHPGYRFARALEVLKTERFRPTGSVEQDWKCLTELVCERLSWVPPLAMAEAYFTAPASGELPLLASDFLDQHRRRAAAARLDSPAVFMDGSHHDEHRVHSQYNLIVPFIVEQGRLRMPESREGFKILFRSALTSMARNIYRSKGLERLFEQPENVSDPIHDAAMKTLFGSRRDKFAYPAPPALDGSSADISSLAAAAPDQLREVVERLMKENLGFFGNAVRMLRLADRQGATEWFGTQPTLVDSILELRQWGPDGSFTIQQQMLMQMIAQNHAAVNERLYELLEDIGSHVLVSDIKYLEHLISMLRNRWEDSSSGDGEPQTYNNESSECITSNPT